MIKSRYHRNKERGLCASCGKVPPKRGFVRCAECLVKAKEEVRKVQLRRKEQGLCVYCNQYAEPGKTMCKKHLKIYTNNYKKATMRRESEGRCKRCGKLLPPGTIYKHCPNCRERL